MKDIKIKKGDGDNLVIERTETIVSVTENTITLETADARLAKIAEHIAELEEERALMNQVIKYGRK